MRFRKGMLTEMAVTITMMTTILMTMANSTTTIYNEDY